MKNNNLCSPDVSYCVESLDNDKKSAKSVRFLSKIDCLLNYKEIYTRSVWGAKIISRLNKWFRCFRMMLVLNDGNRGRVLTSSPTGRFLKTGHGYGQQCIPIAFKILASGLNSRFFIAMTGWYVIRLGVWPRSHIVFYWSSALKKTLLNMLSTDQVLILSLSVFLAHG